MTTANTIITIGVNESKLYGCFGPIGKKYVFWCAAELQCLAQVCYAVKKKSLVKLMESEMGWHVYTL